ncbi:DUF3048 domain-containing protein [Patescibacteria group bacterium]|nr:DUF3048 domain-containing protein [Patescibacteria group bacterium]
MNLKSKTIFIYLGVFLLLFGASYAVFSFISPVVSEIANPNPNNNSQNATPTAAAKTGILTFEGPKVAACPLNGELYTKDEQNIWQTRRPLVVMIENHKDARPQSGLSNADVVYEAVAEGGITRFMGVFYCGAVKGSTQKYDVGPVRSARTYFLDLASEYADVPLYTHVGGANCSAATPGGPCTTNKKALALEQIDQYGWTKKGAWGDMNEFSLSYSICRREYERTGTVKDTEHTMYCSTPQLWNMAANRGLTNITTATNTPWNKNFRSWAFNATDQTVAGGPSTISFDFWPGYKDYSVSWKYDAASNSYVRSNGGQPHIDFDTGKPLTTKNLVIEYAKETRNIDEHMHNLYDVVGTGKGVLLQNGAPAQEITWSKPNRTARTIFRDKNNKEVNFVPGPIWIEILPLGNPVNYES